MTVFRHAKGCSASTYRDIVTTEPEVGLELADDNELFQAVGRAVAAGATLEWTMVDLHATLLHSPRSLATVAGEGFDRARAGCLDHAQLIGEPINELVRSVVLTTSEPWQRRNAVVHGSWLAGSHTGEPGRSGITLRLRRTGLSTDGWTVHSLTDLMNTLSVAAENIDEVRRRLEDGFDLAGFLDKKPPPWQIGPVRHD
jgi:hypothetical protein